MARTEGGLAHQSLLSGIGTPGGNTCWGFRVIQSVPYTGTYQAERGAQRRAMVADYKLEKGCADCGYKQAHCALDFDHRGGKTSRNDQVSWLMNSRLELLLAEILKCDVVCANCHRIRSANRRVWSQLAPTWGSFEPGCCKSCGKNMKGRGTTRGVCRAPSRCADQYRQWRRIWLGDIKLASGCMDCGYAKNYEALDFDHRPGMIKIADISVMLGSSEQRLLAEIAKCDVVCANCHRIRTHVTR